MMFDEQPDGDPHGECGFEIRAQAQIIRDLEVRLKDALAEIAALNNAADKQAQADEEMGKAFATLQDECEAITRVATQYQEEALALRADAERLEYMLLKLPGDALRYVLGELSDTSDLGEFRTAIDLAARAGGGRFDAPATGRVAGVFGAAGGAMHGAQNEADVVTRCLAGRGYRVLQ